MIQSLHDHILPASFLILMILIVGKTLFLRKQGIRPSTKRSKPSSKKVMVGFLFLLILLLWILEAGRSFRSISPLPRFLSEPLMKSQLLQTAGAVLIVVSLVLMAVTLVHFKRSLRFGLDPHNLGKLVTSGIFSVSRNPFFLSLNVYFLGTAVFHPSLFFMAIALATIVSIHFFILKEERFMKENYGDEYQAYLNKTGRYL